ncbi:MAG TPA: M56 family metallopeptidase [Sphingorhabdus sp.]|jgi:beta-lactamase regulating signal transducer with metallopeptidase domain|nr:M56 family metallopeptidase [Sphingorhabdus sp.]
MSGEAFQTWLFDSLLVTTLLMAAILLLRRPVAKAFGPGVAYALWLIPAARLLMPSLESAPAQAAGEAQWVRDAVRESIMAGVSSPDAIVDTASKSVVAAVDLTALGVTFWLGGAALFFIIQMIRYASMRDDLLAEADEIAYIEGVSVIASDQVAGPLAFGLFKRYIAVPQDFAKTYSPAERELAIAHEMAHHKSGDLFANLVAFVVLCLQWFNPVAWMSWNAFRFDQEAACDARVLAGKGSEERAIYGQALARTAFDGVPTFATALNSPKTIIERLRRLSMKDASTKRRVFGKLGVVAATAIILPLTATVVPGVIAQDAPVAPEAPAAPAPADAPEPKIVKKVKIIKIDHDGKTVDIIGEDGDGKKVRKVQRNGKTFVFRTDKELSDAELDKMVEEAEISRKEADKWLEESEKHRGHADAARHAADAAHRSADAAREMAEVHRVRAMKMASAYIPEIDIREVTKNCKAGEPVTTDVSGFDGQGQARVKVVMCGKGMAKIARLEALKGLQEARGEIFSERDMPENVRKEVIEKLEEQIRRLKAQADDNK